MMSDSSVFFHALVLCLFSVMSSHLSSSMPVYCVCFQWWPHTCHHPCPCTVFVFSDELTSIIFHACVLCLFSVVSSHLSSSMPLCHIGFQWWTHICDLPCPLTMFVFSDELTSVFFHALVPCLFSVVRSHLSSSMSVQHVCFQWWAHICFLPCPCEFQTNTSEHVPTCDRPASWRWILCRYFVHRGWLFSWP